MQRQLLYHRGVDDQTGTFITDYISSAGCFLLEIILIIQMFAQCCQAIRKTTIGVVIILFSLTMMSLLGGLTHEFLQLVEPYTSWTDNWTWLVVWRSAASFASLLIFAFFFISHQLMQDEQMYVSGRKSSILFYFVSVSMSGTVFLHSFSMLADTSDPWNTNVTFIATYFCALLQAIINSIILWWSVKNKRKSRSRDHKENVFGSLKELFRNKTEDGGSNINTEESTSADPSSSKRRPRICSNHLVFYCIAPWFFVLSGLVNLILAKSGCADNHHQDNPATCPLPSHFNHNAVLHIMLMFDAFLYFLAESINLRRRRKTHFRSKLAENHKIFAI